jgi:processive 1,2-diacylglycerol beta-glucosyltransferase
MISAGKAVAPQMVERLSQLPEIQLTVTVGRDARLRTAIENVREAAARKFEIVGWSEDLPHTLRASHLLISKAGGATVQETIAAACPMIINQIVPGQEEGNARLIVETKSGIVAESPESVVEAVQKAFLNESAQWREWHENITKLSRPAASLEIAEFLLGL